MDGWMDDRKTERQTNRQTVRYTYPPIYLPTNIPEFQNTNPAYFNCQNSDEGMINFKIVVFHIISSFPQGAFGGH